MKSVFLLSLSAILMAQAEPSNSLSDPTLKTVNKMNSLIYWPEDLQKLSPTDRKSLVKEELKDSKFIDYDLITRDPTPMLGTFYLSFELMPKILSKYIQHNKDTKVYYLNENYEALKIQFDEISVKKPSWILIVNKGVWSIVYKNQGSFYKYAPNIAFYLGPFIYEHSRYVKGEIEAPSFPFSSRTIKQDYYYVWPNERMISCSHQYNPAWGAPKYIVNLGKTFIAKDTPCYLVLPQYNTVLPIALPNEIMPQVKKMLKSVQSHSWFNSEDAFKIDEVVYGLPLKHLKEENEE